MKSVIISMLMLVSVMAWAGDTFYASSDIVVPPGVTNIVTGDIQLFDRVMAFRDIEEVTFKSVTSFTNAAFVLVGVDIGVETVIASASGVAPDSSAIIFPLRADVRPGITNYVRYGVRTAKIYVTQGATNVPSVYRWSIKAK